MVVQVPRGTAPTVGTERHPVWRRSRGLVFVHPHSAGWGERPPLAPQEQLTLLAVRRQRLQRQLVATLSGIALLTALVVAAVAEE